AKRELRYALNLRGNPPHGEDSSRLRTTQPSPRRSAVSLPFQRGSLRGAPEPRLVRMIAMGTTRHPSSKGIRTRVKTTDILRRLIGTCATLAVLRVCPVAAATYYVDPNAACSDSNAGTSASAPWCTIPGSRNQSNTGFLRSNWGAINGSTQKISCGDRVLLKGAAIASATNTYSTTTVPNAGTLCLTGG